MLLGNKNMIPQKSQNIGTPRWYCWKKQLHVKICCLCLPLFLGLIFGSIEYLQRKLVGAVQVNWTCRWSENSELQDIVVPVDYDLKKREYPEVSEWYRFAAERQEQKSVKGFSSYPHDPGLFTFIFLGRPISVQFRFWYYVN